MKKVLIGHIGVDAGLCWIGDPCYIFNGERPKAIGKDWGEFCDELGMLNEKSYNYDAGHEGLGVVTSTGWGDGTYPVYAYKNDEGRTVKVEIDFNPEEE